MSNPRPAFTPWDLLVGAFWCAVIVIPGFLMIGKYALALPVIAFTVGWIKGGKQPTA